MKTTIDLPDALIQEIRRRALREGRKLKDAVADLLWKGLEVGLQANSIPTAPRISRDKVTGLPVVQCTKPASPGNELTPARVAEVLLAQEVEWHRATC